MIHMRVSLPEVRACQRLICSEDDTAVSQLLRHRASPAGREEGSNHHLSGNSKEFGRDCSIVAAVYIGLTLGQEKLFTADGNFGGRCRMLRRRTALEAASPLPYLRQLLFETITYVICLTYGGQGKFRIKLLAS